jgi:hypothetical protein
LKSSKDSLLFNNKNTYKFKNFEFSNKTEKSNEILKIMKILKKIFTAL